LHLREALQRDREKRDKAALTAEVGECAAGGGGLHGVSEATVMRTLLAVALQQLQHDVAQPMEGGVLETNKGETYFVYNKINACTA